MSGKENKVKNVAIWTKSFMDWNGGVDFIKNIIIALSSVSKKNGLKLYLILSEDQSDEDFIEFEKCTIIKYRHNELSKTLEEFNIDIILPHSNYNFFDLNVKSIAYLYDCQHKYFPEFFKKEELEERDDFFLRMINSGEKIIVNAASVKNDFIKFFNAEPSNIVVLPFTPKLKTEYLEQNRHLIEKYKLPERYFLISNQFWRHKDHKTAFEAFSELVKGLECKDIKLICTGLMEDSRHPEYMRELFTLIDNLRCKDKIECLGLIPKIEQIEIMKGALAVIQPTLFEGGPGGGSVWDAMALGVPAILSDISTNLEINDENVSFFYTKKTEDLLLRMKEIIDKKIERPSKRELVERSKKNIIMLGTALCRVINEVCDEKSK